MNDDPATLSDPTQPTAALEPSEPSEPSERAYLAFYDRLRVRIQRAIAGPGGNRLRVEAAELLLLAPDLFMLLARLVLDPDTPASSRGVLGGALAYFLLPVDLLPEALLGVGGFSEDLLIAAVALTYALSEELEPRARLYWSGSKELHKTLRDVVVAAEALLGAKLTSRIQRYLAARGLPLHLAGRDR